MASSNRPGVEITQALTETPAVVASPALVPVVVGVCRQVIEATDADGALNADAKYTQAQYNQASMFIPGADFPDPRANIDELTIDNATVSASLYFGGTLRTLDRGSNDTYGSAFLKLMNASRRAAIRTSVASPFAFDGTAGNPFTFALDVVNSSNTSSDVTVTLLGSMTASEVAAAINTAAGATVATVVTIDSADYLQVASVYFGADSSVTLRAGTSALKILFGSNFDDSVEYRVEGAGFRGQDDQDNDLTTPWIEFYRGGYFEGGVEQVSFDSYNEADVLYAGQIDMNEQFLTSKAAAVTFTGTSATAPLVAASASRPGDQFWGDGTRIGGGDIVKIETSRFKVGKLNNSLSTFDDDGQPTNRLYDTVEVNTTSHSTPFAPKYAYFVAEGLTFGSITPAGVAATITGSNQGLEARAAYVQGNGSGITFPINLASLTLNFAVTEDGVEGDEVTHTFAGGPYANIDDLITAMTSAGVFGQLTLGATPAGDLLFQTTKTGADQAVSIKSTGTANASLNFSTSSATTDTGKDVEFATQASATSGVFNLPLGDTSARDFTLTVTDAKGEHVLAVTGVDMTAGTLAAMVQAIAEAFGDPDGSASPTIYDGGIPVATLSYSGDTSGTVTVTSIEGGTSVLLEVTGADAGDGWHQVGFGNDVNASGVDGLKSSTLTFNLDDNPYDYSITFDSNSLQDAIDGVNQLVNGSADVASESTRALKLTSLLAGAASRITTDANQSAEVILGLQNADVAGSGRPNPDFYIDGEGAVNIGPNILRNKSSGIPFSLESAFASLYIAYTALRRDVTSSAADAALLSFGSSSDMEASIGPISTKNPLALGMFLAMANAPSNLVSGLGVDEATAAAPLGTLDGWMRALEYLESKEVYGLAPLTDDEYVQSLIATHVTSMSVPTERGERICFIWSSIPSRAVTVTVSSGEDGQTNGSSNSFTLDKNPNSDLIAQGLDPSDPIPVSAQLYLELVVTVDSSSELRRYCVSDVNGVVLSLTTSFASGENDDGFFTTATLDEELSGVDWALKIRGAALLLSGTSIPDRNAQVVAAGAAGEPYSNRRVYYLACDSVDTSIDGVTQNVEGFYAAAAIVGMVAEQSPQQPFTNVPIAGIGRVYGTDDTFHENQLDTIADGGRYVLVNFGGKVAARKQLSTSTTSIESKELSITKAIDWLSKGLRATNRAFIGRSTLTGGFLDQLTMSNQGFLDYAVQLGAVRKAALTSLLQDTSAPDTVLIQVTVQPVYPCNKIKITIVS